MGNDSSKEGVKPLPEVSKLTNKDWAKIESHLKEELQNRKNSDFRRNAEAKWKEIDRQIAMNPMTKVNRDGSEVDQGWHNVVELGELSRASENITADVLRIVFPSARYHFEVHADIEDMLAIDKGTGKKKKDTKLQQQVNGRLRSFMAQQHVDFKLKDRVELSIKEALHRGSFVVEVDWDTQEFVHDAVKVRSKSAPIWRPHSMWNCYLDQSPSVLGTNLFYDGSLFIEDYAPRHRAERMVKTGGEGWMPKQWRKVSKDEHTGKDGEKIKDVKITKYWGDIYIDRSDETMWYPNHKAILMNGTLVYMAPNKTPYPPVIVGHYERLDVRDPYGTSPVVKQSPMQKLGTQLANKYMDGIELSLEPPIVYDGNDPDFVLNGGPTVEPGSKVSTKGSNAFSVIEVGDPRAALEGLQLVLGEMKEKLGRPGRPVGDRATKAEVVKNQQDEEVSIVNFIGKMETAVLSFLYMQHAMNLDRIERYSYYSPEMQDPDFILVTKSDLPKAVHFEVVGARGVLGEEERAQKFTQVFAFALGNQLTAGRIDVDEGLKQMFQDAGTKNPERFLANAGEVNPGQLAAQNQQLKAALQKVGGLLQQEKNKTGAKMAKIQTDAQAKERKLQVDSAQRERKMQQDFASKMEQIRLELIAEIVKHGGERAMHIQSLLNERWIAAMRPQGATVQ